MEIKTPFLHEDIAAGDVVKKITSALGIRTCGGCQKRAEAMNKAIQFTPRESPWKIPPEVPEGWSLEREHFTEGGLVRRMFSNSRTGGIIIWDIVNGRYQNSKSFCCHTLRPRAEAAWENLCR